MSWRTVVISSRCKLDTKMGYMVIRGEEVRRIFLDEIAVVIIENPAVAMTGCLLSELMERKIKVVFCDRRHNPQGELVPYYGSHDTSRKLRTQIAWQDATRGAVWGSIIAQKISQQAKFLRDLEHFTEAELPESYIGQIEFQDATNREGHAAKVYFNAVFGMDFSRRGDHPYNAALNYGYTILLSAFNREITASGYALVVENPDFFRHLLCDLYGQLQGDDGKLILSEKGKPLAISKWVELVDNCIHFELNRKSLVIKICTAMERTAVSETFFLKTSELLCSLERYVDELAFELPGDIICEKCSVSALLRGIGIGLRDDYEDPLERLIDFMELVREFDRDKLFVLVGLRNFFSDVKVEAFLKTALDHGYRLLLLDSVARDKLSCEKRLTIDNDLCEF